MITPMDIHNKTFSKGLRGYSEEEVNDFLRQIVTDYEQIYREHREMEEEMDQMKVKLSNYERISDTMTATLQLAKDTGTKDGGVHLGGDSLQGSVNGLQHLEV